MEVRYNDIYLFKKYVIVTGLLTLADPLLLYCTVATDQSHLLLLCDHCNDGIVTTSGLPVIIVSYGPLIHMYIAVVMYSSPQHPRQG
jgi:hypothetical protein